MIEQPDIRPVSESSKPYMVFADYQYSGFVVPRGFRLDLASVPRFLWSSIGILPDGMHRAAACMHDYLYQQGGNAKRDNQSFEYNRRFADKMFRDMMYELHLVKWHVIVLYLGVRLFGRFSWKRR